MTGVQIYGTKRKRMNKVEYKPIRTLEEFLDEFDAPKQEVKVEDLGEGYLVVIPLFGFFNPDEVSVEFLSNKKLRITYSTEESELYHGALEDYDVKFSIDVELPGKVNPADYLMSSNGKEIALFLQKKQLFNLSIPRLLKMKSTTLASYFYGEDE